MQKNPGSLKRRFAALAIDYLVIVAYIVVLLGATLLFYYFVFGHIPDILGTFGPAGSQLVGFITLTLPIGLYFYCTESGPRHATVGKRAAKIFVTSFTSNPIQRSQIAVRTIIKLLPWEFAHTLVHQTVYYSQNGGTPPTWVMTGLIIANLLPLTYIAMIIFRRDHRGPHDLVARTIVVSTK